jgi:hypothetical protein
VGLRLRHSAERRVARRLQLQVSYRTRPVRYKDVKKAAGWQRYKITRNSVNVLLSPVIMLSADATVAC